MQELCKLTALTSLTVRSQSGNVALSAGSAAAAHFRYRNLRRTTFINQLSLRRSALIGLLRPIFLPNERLKDLHR